MADWRPLTREEIGAVYDAGREAVVAVIEALQEQVATLPALTARVKALEDRLALDSHNSSKPPSSDGGRPAPAPRSLRPPPGTSGRRPGGQPGHPGTTLRLVATPDRLVRHRPLVTTCGACGQGLGGGAERLADERRQVVDLPPLALEVTEHRVVHVACPACGVETAGTFPVGVTQPVQYGDRLKAVSVYLQAYQLLPYDRTCQLLDDLFGTAPAEGTLAAAATACFVGLAATETAIAGALQQAGVGHFDETGVRVNGHREWLHVASTPTLTHYGVHPKRGRAATDAIGILPAFTGTATHDAWAPYLTYDACAHALCNAHLLRELIFLYEQDHQAWADELATLLVTAKDLADTARVAGRAGLDEGVRATIEAHYDHLLDQGTAANPSVAPPPTRATAAPKRGRPKHTKAQNLLHRLTTRRTAVLAFVHDLRVPFDNNQAERDLRMMKVQQKISGGFRSPDGAAIFARLRGYLSTLRKQGLPVLDALRATLAGAPLMPNLAR
ncbi:MAG: IS66 family transposase [Chloroflexota bacterium]|nr:IS66 family transposase [Chloroflexota bacterium]